MARADQDASSTEIAKAIDPSRLGPDVTDCDREPIHIPGAIQPHGLLLVVDAASGTIVQGAGAIEDRLAADWQGRPAHALIGDGPAAKLGEGAEGRTLLGTVRGVRETFALHAHQVFERFLIELEPVPDTAWSAAEMLAALAAASATFERAGNLKALCAAAAVAYRTLTGFDRVMVYRFLDDDAGMVVAEDRAARLGSFMNHHFPASDIPRQARALYVRNRVRVIPDAGYTPAPLRPAAETSVDMSDVDLRSVSPIHLQYLRNMGVGASASISIVKDGLLWGLIACHHETPRQLPPDVRMACSALAGGLSRQIRAKEDAELYRERIRLRASEDLVAARLGLDSALDSFFAETGDELCRMLDADGFAAIQGGELFTAGRCPDRDAVREIAAWARGRAMAAPLATTSLGEQLRDARNYREQASGLLAVTMSTDEPTVMMWFRAEQIEVVNWAGNPHKATRATPGATLTPRASFESWGEAVSGTSRAWTLGQIEAAGRLRRTLLEARQNQRLVQLNQRLSTALADKESLLAQKDFLLREVNHRVQNSLQLVSAFLGLQARAENDPGLTKHLAEAQRRLNAVALVHKRLYGEDAVQTVDLGRYVEDLCTDLADATDGERRDLLTVDAAPILISADRAVTVGLILTELVINANKYAYGGEPGPVSITLEQYRNRLRLIVADEGVGKTGTRKGFGSRMMDAMVERLAGTIEERRNAPGLRIVLTAPIEDEPVRA